jgi:fructosamine-3-kinase
VTVFSRRVAELTGVAEERLEPLVAESVAEVLLVRRADNSLAVAKQSPSAGAEAAMLGAIAGAGVPTPMVEGEHDNMLLLEYVENDGLFSARAWADIGARVRTLHDRTGNAFGWPVDYAIGTVTFDSRETRDWPRFWGEQRLIATAALLDRPWRERIERLAGRLGSLLPAQPSFALLHGDLWSGNVLVRDGSVVGMIDPACYHGDAEVDLAMLDLFSTPPEDFDEGYGPRLAGWRERQPIYQLFPALVHLRLWGPGYYPMVDRLLTAIGF